MARIRRNDPCPCGSEKKYKKCCMPISFGMELPPQLPHEYQRMMRLIEEGSVSRKKSMRDAVQVIYQTTRHHKEWDQVAFDADRIKIIFSEIDSYITTLLRSCPHSRQYWYQLIRFYAPMLWNELSESHIQQSRPDWFGRVIKNASEFILANSEPGEPKEWIEEGPTRGIDYRDITQKEFDIIAEVFALAQLRYEAQICIRFSTKGYSVFSDTKEDALQNQDTHPITNYETRRSEFDTLVGTTGLWIDDFNITPLRKELCLWFGLLTVESDHFMLHSKEPTEEISMQYLLSPAMEGLLSHRHNRTVHRKTKKSPKHIPYDSILEHPDLRLSFEAAFNRDPAEITSFIYAVYRLIYSVLRFPRINYGDAGTMVAQWIDESHEQRENALHHWKDIGTRGFLRTRKRDWIDRLHHELTVLYEHDDSIALLTKDDIAELVSRFTWKDERPTYNNAPFLFIEISSKTLLWDGFFAVDFIRNILLTANLIVKDTSSTASGNDETGPWLEQQAMSYLIRNLNLESEKVIQGKEIKKDREIDIAFVYKRTLFVIECKAMAKDAALIGGDYSKLRNRLSTARWELTKKNKQRIELIENGHARDTIKPDSFDKAYGLVCTSAVEYLPFENEEGKKEPFWINQIPVVGPPPELLQSIRALVEMDTD